MTEYADIVTEDGSDPNLEWWRGWLVIETYEDGGVHFRSDYRAPDSEERRTWQDSGISFDAKHLDAVIEALIRIREARDEG